MREKLPIQIRFELDELAAIDSYRRTQLNPPTRPQAIREILGQVLTWRNAEIGTSARHGGGQLNGLASAAELTPTAPEQKKPRMGTRFGDNDGEV